MIRLLLSFVVAVFSFTACPSVAVADILTDPTEVCQAARTRAGAWLDDAGLQRCLKLDTNFPLLQAEADNLKLQVQSLEREANTFAETVRDKDDMIFLLTRQDDASQKMISNLESEVSAWYRNPWLMVGIGLAAGAAITAGVVVAISVH